MSELTYLISKSIFFFPYNQFFQPAFLTNALFEKHLRLSEELRFELFWGEITHRYLPVSLIQFQIHCAYPLVAFSIQLEEPTFDPPPSSKVESPLLLFAGESKRVQILRGDRAGVLEEL